MRLSLDRLTAIESRLSGRVQHLDSHAYSERADLIDGARRRVQRARERRLAEQASSGTKEAA